MSWAWTTATAFNVAGALAIAVFGILVATRRPRTPQATAVAAFSVAFGVATCGTNLLIVAGPATATGQLFGWLAVAAVIVATGALGVMWRILPSPLRADWRILALPVLVSGLTVALLAVPMLTGRADSPTVERLGPSMRLYLGMAGVQVGIWWGLILLLASRFARGGAGSGETPLLASALALYPATNTNFIFGDDPALALFSRLDVAIVLIVTTAWLRAGHRAGRPRAGRAVAWIVLAVALAGLIEGTLGGELAAGLGLNGLSRIASVAVLSYAVVRHHVLGIDVKLRWGLSKSTVAAVFIAVFFVSSEAAQQFLGDTTGSQYLGIAAAGALVFAIAPLQRAADRLAERAVPVAPAPTSVSGADSAVDIYRKQVALAWTDGRISPNERVMLRGLRKNLGLDVGTADEIEDEIETARMRQEAP